MKCVGKFIDLTGQKFGRWTVLSLDTNAHGGLIHWLCRCDCGNISSVLGGNLRTGKTKSCGCLKSEKSKEMMTKHGGALNADKVKPRLYSTWCNMRKRCNNKNSSDYKYYGARGISVCREWDDYAAFEAWALRNGYKDSLTIDRKDVNGNYCPENCRWITQKEQTSNRRSNHIIAYKGKAQTLTEWSRQLDMSLQTLSNRINHYGWCVEDALTKPIKGKD